MRPRSFAFFLFLGMLLLTGVAGAQQPGTNEPWTPPASREEYDSWSLEKKIEIYRAVVAHPFYLEWNKKKLPEQDAMDPSRGAYDEFLLWLPLSPQDMLEIDMHLRHWEAAIPRLNFLLTQRWLWLHFGVSGATGEAGHADGMAMGPPGSGPLATVGTNRNVATTASPSPDDYQGEVQVAANPSNSNQIVAMANTWDNLGDTTNCGGGTQAIFFSSDGGATWGYTCAPRGARYGLSCASGNEAGSDPALAWDTSGNVYANYMSLCYNASWTAVDGYAMVVAKSTNGGSTWSPHGILQNSYSSDSVEDKNFYIIDNNPASPYFGRHYSCWDRGNDELIKYSSDGGVTWTEVNLPDTYNTLDLGCEMAVEDNGTVHVIFDSLTCGIITCTDEDMYYTRSTDGGASWSPLVPVRDITNPISFGSSAKYGPQDERGLNPFGAIDVDNSGGACDGYLYVTFTDDADNNGVGTADIWVMRSTNGGTSWGSAVRVNDTPNPDTSIQFHPFLVVDQANGHVYVAWHDARNDPNNRKVDFYVARSTDCGLTWENVQASQASGEFNNATISWTDENSSDNTGNNPNQFGEYMGLDVRNGVAFLAWTDTRHFYPGSTSEPQKENIGFATVTFCSLSAPTSLVASTPGDNAVQLTWSSVSGASEYRVYRSTTSGGPYTQIGSTASTSYLDNTVQGGVTYYYAVRAYSAVQACESVNSAEVAATPSGPCAAPPDFAGLASATSSGTSACGIDLAWSSATAHCGGPISYNVYRSTVSGFTPSESNRIAVGVTGTSYHDGSGLVSGTTYYYVVRAYDEAGMVEDSNTVQQSAAPLGSSSPATLYGPENFDGYADGNMAGWSRGSFAGDANDWRGVRTCSAHSGGKIFRYGGNGCTNYYRINNHAVAYRAVSVPAGSSNVRWSFWHRWEFEANYDGAYLRISFDGLTFSYVPSSAILSGGYNGTISGGTLQAWNGSRTSFQQTVVDLDAACNAAGSSDGCQGKTVYLGFTVFTDGSFNYDGWFIDDVQVTANVPGSCSNTPGDVEVFTARATDGEVKLEWVNPSSPYGSTRICRSTSTYPTDPTSCSVVVDQAGAAGAYGSFTDTGLANNTVYYYTAFVNDGSGTFSEGKSVWARPFATSGKVKWAYHTGESALQRPGVYPGAVGTGAGFAVSNDRLLHGVNPTAAGGDWPRNAPYSWEPMAMNAPAQSRPPVVPVTVGAASLVVFLGSEDGHVYAADARTGATLWQSPQLAAMLVGAPSGIFSAFGGAVDLLFAGTRDVTANNVLYALNPATGAVVWTFDNGGGSGGIGIISATPTVDYATSRVYFTSRARTGGSSDTVWCLAVNGSGATKLWSVNVGNVDASPVVFGGRVYVGTNDGHVVALDAATGAQLASFATGDGAVKGYVVPEFTSTLPRHLYLATTSTIWALLDQGATITSAWSTTLVPGPSTPLVVPGTSKLYAGSTNGHLYQLNASSGTVETSVVLGDGTATIGSPALDGVNSFAFAGSEAGAVYGVQVPLQP